MPKRTHQGVTSGIGPPTRMAGKDGDITIRTTREGKVLYVKDSGQWYSINTNIDIVKIRNVVNRIVKETKLIRNSGMPLRPVVEALEIRKNVITATIDPKIVFSIGGADKFVMGIDDSDSDKFKIDAGTSTVGGATKVTLDSSGNMTTTGSLTATKSKLTAAVGTDDGESGYDSTSKSYKFNTSYLFVNATNIADSTAGLSIASETGNDSFIQFMDSSTNKWGLGYDQDDSGEFKIFSGAWSSGTERLAFTTAGNLTVSGTITSSAGTLGVGDITGVTLTGDSGGALSDTSGSADFTIAGGTNCASAGSGSTITLNVDDAFVKNDADDTMAGTLTIDKNGTATSTSTVKGMHLDFDQTGISASGQTLTGIGLDLDMNCETVTHVGTVNQTGIDIDMVAATGGTQTNTGIDISCTGADTNTHLQLSHDATNYCTFRTIANGATTIATTDSDGTDADLTLDADGDIVFNADGGNITMLDGILPLVAFSQGQLDVKYNATNYIRTAVSSAGVATLSTVGGTAADADFIVDSGGDITLDSGTGIFIAKNAGTEFSVANSAYAGMILGYTTVGIDAADDSYTLTATMEAIDDALKVKFVAPPSGVVEIFAQIYFDAARRGVVLGLSDQPESTGYRAISFPNATDVTNEHLQIVPPSSLGDQVLRPHWVVTGLTPGTAYEWWIGAKTNIATGGVLRWGGNVTNEYPPFIMKAIALPTAVADFAVYG